MRSLPGRPMALKLSSILRVSPSWTMVPLTGTARGKPESMLGSTTPSTIPSLVSSSSTANPRLPRGTGLSNSMTAPFGKRTLKPCMQLAEEISSTGVKVTEDGCPGNSPRALRRLLQ